jgi:hypothetical protein
VVAGIGAAALVATSVVHTQSVSALPFAKNFLITGNYVVGSVDLAPQSGANGFLTGTIPVSGVPATAEVLAAYLYWETISTDIAQVDGAEFRGSPIVVVKQSYSTLTGGTAQCWTSGGGSGASYRMTMFRADVLRQLPIETDSTGKPTGRILVNSADLTANGKTLHTVKLPEAGTGNQVPSTAGATLLVIYRDAAQPLTSISVYDGISVQAPGTTMSQTIRGFLQASASPTGRMTHIVGSGAKNTTDRLLFNGVQVGADLFGSVNNASSDRGWSSPTLDVTNQMNLRTDSFPYGEQVTTSVDHTSSTPYDCLAWAAIVFATPVADVDADGLPDKLEELSGLKEPDDTPLPDLHAMGASKFHKDLFVEAGAMQAAAGTTYGAGAALETDSVGHNHLPTPAVIKLLGDAYKNAPYGNADGSTGIHLHMDVGSGYHLLGADYASTEADEYIISGGSGGELIQEVACDVATPDCQFPGYPGTVSWKIGYQLYRDAPVASDGHELDAAGMDACEVAGNCRRRFDQNRLNFFHYILYAHSRAKPKDLCLTGTDDEKAACRNTVAYHTPSTASGVSDQPGGDSMVTLGGWGHGFVGSDFVRASTTMHELGHSFWRGHGGPAIASPTENCKPNYLSIMNYLFQLGGLRDDAGTPHLDYSRAANTTLDENNLPGGPLGLPYRTAWYAPLLPGSLAAALGTPAAGKYCNGGILPTPLPADWVPMARIDAASVLAPIDWSGGLGTVTAQDVNFDGTQSASLAGSNDWADIRLDQVGSRRNMAGFSLGIDFTDAIDFNGGIDFAFGIDYTGGIDYAFGIDYTGGIDFAFGIDYTGGIDYAFGIDYTGGIDFAFGIDYTGGAELDREIAKGLGNTPANKFKACILGGVGPEACQNTGGPLHRTQGDWKLPDVGTVNSYDLFRMEGDVVTPASLRVLAATAQSPDTTSVDVTELPHGVKYTYFVVSRFADGSSSGASNFSIVTAINDAPVAVPDSYSVGQNGSLSIASRGVLGNDTDTDSDVSTLTAVKASDPAHGTLALNANGSFTYTPVSGYSGTDSFTYMAKDVSPISNRNAPVTVTITVVPLETVPPTITIITPVDGASYVLNSTVLANYSCADASGIASCVGNVPSGQRINTATVGPKSFTVTATDNAGNQSSKTVNYLVVYAVTISPLKSPAQLGSAVPVQWQLKDALGVAVNSLSTLLKMESVFNGPAPAGGCSVSTTGTRTILFSPATGATGGSSFRLTTTGYQFNWDSTTAKGTGKGCYTLLLTFNDGSAPKLTTAVQLK